MDLLRCWAPLSVETFLRAAAKNMGVAKVEEAPRILSAYLVPGERERCLEPTELCATLVVVMRVVVVLER